ncbi:UDP-4-amino-4,6-dideoxy-N-acetyl-beta-L-altrosamine N-acetyltransferase [Vreelandella rituensis]|nr:UDP-4-amino-4,6-dideoxy-N-acetyl-beta-L-altrosamine N-acetyltransferase [Halomonas rituensis]
MSSESFWKNKIMALREIGENDLELMLRWRNHPSVRSSMFSQSVIELEKHKLWFEREFEKSDSEWLIFLDEGNTPRGVMYFTEMNRVSRNAFWGFYTAPDAPPGTGTKMGREALIYYFNDLGFHKLNADVLESNERSYYFHLKLGFNVEGVFRDQYMGTEGYESVTRFALIEGANSGSGLKVCINE